MSNVSVEQLKDILRRIAGEDEVDVDGDALDRPFADLGFDSLAMLETAALIKRELGVDIEDGDLHGDETPRDLLARINDQLAAAA